MAQHNTPEPGEEGFKPYRHDVSGQRYRCPGCNGIGRIARPGTVAIAPHMQDSFISRKTIERLESGLCPKCEGRGWILGSGQ